MRVWDSVISRWFGGGNRAAVLRWCRSWKAGACLVLLGLTVYLPGLFTIPPIDRDESRFAQASRQMFESAALPKDLQNPAFHSGGWVVPMVQDRARLNKPPLVYWLQVASAWLFTGGDPLKDAIWMYRVPGVLCALLTVLMTWRLGLSMFDPRAAVMAAALLAVCPLVVFDAHQARADQLLLTTVVGMQWGLWGAWRRAKENVERGKWKVEIGTVAGAGDLRSGISDLKSEISNLKSPEPGGARSGSGGSKARGPGPGGWAFMFWLFLGLSILAKGPIGPMIAVLTIAALCLATRSWRWTGALKPVIGLVIVVAMVAPWVWAVGEHVGWEKYIAIVKDETIGRSLEPKEGHWGPPGYHTVLLAVLFWPGSLTTAMAVGRAFKKGFPANPERQRRAAVASEKTSGSNPSQSRGVIQRLRHASANAARRLRYGSAGRSAELFLLAWIVPAWIVFELIGTKLPHYTMPMYPAVALLSARALFSISYASKSDEEWDRQRIGRVAWVSIGTVLIGGLMLACVFIPLSVRESESSRTHHIERAILAQYVACVIAGLCLWRAATAARSRSVLSAQISMVAAFGVLAAGFLQFLAPRLLPGAMTPDIWRAITKAKAWYDRPLAAEFHEDSLVFWSRGRVVRTNPPDMSAWWKSHPRGIAVIKASEFDERNGQYSRLGVVGNWPDLSGPVYYEIVELTDAGHD